MKKSWKDRNSLALSLALGPFPIGTCYQAIEEKNIHANPVRKMEMAAKMYVVQMKMYDVYTARINV